MKIKELFLSEAPLPDDWEKDIYDPSVPFKKRINYARERASRLGAGSSRIVFEIPYQGQLTALKIAKNRKGIAQNEEEASILNDAEVLSREHLVARLIDGDYDNFTWIQTEKVDKLKSEKHFESLVGFSIFQVISYIGKIASLDGTIKFDMDPDLEEEMSEDEFVQDLMGLLGDTGAHVGDLYRVANWGVKDNLPVIVDFGASSEVLRLHYGM